MSGRGDVGEGARILSRRDLDFLLFEWLDVEALTTRPRFADHSRETFAATLDLCEQIAVDHFASHNKKSDANEPHFDGERVHIIPEVKAALEVFRDAGLFAAAHDYDLGGMQLPLSVEKAAFAWFQAANVGTAAYPFLTIAASNLVVAHGTPQQFETYGRPMLEGRFFGTMCLSEPQAGSSLSDIATRAEPQADGTYRLFGSKMWISAGEHEMADNIVHLVLAKIPGGPVGAKGISLFIVPRRLVGEDGALGDRNDVALAGLNHKMGYRGTVNTLLNFGEGRYPVDGQAGAVGYLVGEANQGLTLMFHMMNEARIGVGAGAAALGYTGYLHALDYARERPQGRPVSAKDPTTPQVALVRHADIRRMLLAQKAYVEGAMALNLYCARLVDHQSTAPEPEVREDAGLLLEILTPIAKSWPSQWCLTANDLAIQIHGGYGYTRDYNVEQFYRDNRLNPIHEGATAIHGLDLLGRKVTLAKGRALELLADRIRASVVAARASGLQESADAVEGGLNRLLEVTAGLLTEGDAELRLANATVYLDAFGHLVLAWIWLEQMRVAVGKDGDFYKGKLAAGRFFHRWELPTNTARLALLESLDPTTLEMQDAWF
jgi:alkylation response protein AidB-like acyl-CoA dehydrogenase